MFRTEQRATLGGMGRLMVVGLVLVGCGAPEPDVGIESPLCGNGVVDTGEECDVGHVPSCEDIGYYGVAPTCIGDCTLDTTACMGRCGDHVLQTAYGETCDGTAPETTCIDEHHAYGIMRCGATCAADTTGCSDYGWATLFDGMFVLDEVAANLRGAIAIEHGSHDILVSWNGSLSRRTNPGWTAVVASGPHLIGVGASTFGWFDGTWHDHAIAIPAAIGAATTSTGLIYALAAGCKVAQISEATGATTALPVPALDDCRSPVTVNDQLYVASLQGVYRWTGTAWIEIEPHATSLIRRSAGGRLVSFSGDYYDLDISLTPAVRTLIPTSTPPHDLAIDIDSVRLEILTLDPRVVVDGVSALASAPPSNVDRVIRSEDGSVVAFGRGAYRFEPQLAISSAVLGSVAELYPLAAGGLAYCGTNVGWIDTTTGDGAREMACSQLVGDPRAAHDVRAHHELFHWDAASGYTPDLVGESVLQIAGSPGLLFAYVAPVEIRRRDAGSWSVVPMPADCVPDELAGIPGALYALARCSAVATVLRFDGAAFVKVTSSPQPLAGANVLRDGTLTTSGFILDANTLVPMPAFGRAFGASKSEYFIEAFSDRITHVEGATTSVIYLPCYRCAVSDHALYGLDSFPNDLFVLPRPRLRRPGSGL